MPDLLELATEACREAVRNGAQFADAEIGSARSVSINIEKGGIHDAGEKRGSGVSVRSIIKGATGYSSCS